MIGVWNTGTLYLNIHETLRTVPRSGRQTGRRNVLILQSLAHTRDTRGAIRTALRSDQGGRLGADQTKKVHRNEKKEKAHGQSDGRGKGGMGGGAGVGGRPHFLFAFVI